MLSNTCLCVCVSSSWASSRCDPLSSDCDLELVLTWSPRSSRAEATSFSCRVCLSLSEVFKIVPKLIYTSWGAGWQEFCLGSWKCWDLQKYLTCLLHFCLVTWVVCGHKAGVSCVDLWLEALFSLSAAEYTIAVFFVVCGQGSTHFALCQGSPRSYHLTTVTGCFSAMLPTKKL